MSNSRNPDLRCDIHEDLRQDWQRLGDHDDARTYTPEELRIIDECGGLGRCDRCYSACMQVGNPFRTNEEDAAMWATINWVRSLGFPFKMVPTERRRRKTREEREQERKANQ